ncbi:MAG: efflux RND transporter periplasmic adaptor subunit, partial [Flavobacteriales bacterium]|nr:efflux RND transporter periplasmic adaptor subunit [Flavobacteriales bacterium]
VPKGTMRPGMFATGTVQVERSRGDSGTVVPKSAVLWTGQRSVVYVKDPGAEQGSFRLREVTLGPSLGEHQVITSGLRPGEEVVVNGTFTVDAAAQLNGAPSMMSPEGGPAPLGHQHGISPGSAPNEGAAHEAHGAEEISLQVSGNCEMCKARIEEAARSLPGVHAATWDVDRKTLMAHIDTTVTDRSDVSKAIAKVGHDTELDKADIMVYEKLPACCLYR